MQHCFKVGFTLQLLVLVRGSNALCDLQNLPANCNSDLLDAEIHELQDEASRTADCLLKGIQTLDERQVRQFRCLLDHVQGQHLPESPEARCVLCQAFQLYNCEQSTARSKCEQAFMEQLNRIHHSFKLRGVQHAVSPWVRRFLGANNWNIHRFKPLHGGNESVNPIRPAYVYAREETHYMDRLRDKLSYFLVRVGGIPGLVAIKLLYLSCLLLNCLLFKVLVCQRELRAHTLLINLVVGDVLNLLFDNFVAVFFITHWNPSQFTVNALVYLNYAIIALQIYTVILYSLQRRLSAPRTSFLGRHVSLLATVLLWSLAALVPAPICLLTMSAKNGILYSFAIYVLIPIVCIIVSSKEKSNDNICNCQGCSEISSTEKICQNFVDRSLQTERWLENNPAETSFDSEINSGETVFCSESERRESLEESALHLQRSSQPCAVQQPSRSQGMRFQRALAIVYVVTYLPAICLYLALYFAIRREEFISYRRLCVYIYSFLNPLALYIADKTVRKYFRNAICCCCNRIKKRSDKFNLAY